MENDKDIELIGDGQDNWAQHVEDAVLGGNWEIGEDTAGVIGDPQHHYYYGLKPVLDHACRAVVEKLEFFVLFVDVGAGLAIQIGILLFPFIFLPLKTLILFHDSLNKNTFEDIFNFSGLSLPIIKILVILLIDFLLQNHNLFILTLNHDKLIIITQRIILMTFLFLFLFLII